MKIHLIADAHGNPVDFLVTPRAIPRVFFRYRSPDGSGGRMRAWKTCLCQFSTPGDYYRDGGGGRDSSTSTPWNPASYSRRL